MPVSPRRFCPSARHPLVRSHPVTGQKSLLLAEQILSHIDGMTETASHELVARLTRHALEPRFHYRHRWRDGDLLIWDNFSTLHRATAFDAENELRLLYRAIIDRVR